MSLAYHSTEYLENQIETFKILLGKRDSEIARLRAQNELTHAAYVEENNRLMAERETLREALSTAKRELNDAEEARNDAEMRLLANLTAARHDAVACRPQGGEE